MLTQTHKRIEKLEEEIAALRFIIDMHTTTIGKLLGENSIHHDLFGPIKEKHFVSLDNPKPHQKIE